MGAQVKGRREASEGRMETTEEEKSEAAFRRGQESRSTNKLSHTKQEKII
ncbi:Hypothetical protein SMAX5B_015417 [Scophthalmus maximus]|uniref:Uncharacterized protein n=1 Tax=Scophthalmus maximus TaxID=52904 RepID=A0A2U9BXH2_SCOMX|nr:Hypothetical protein SMAX5B_015417 [Scophthalmus maximus]